MHKFLIAACGLLALAGAGNTHAFEPQNEGSLTFPTGSFQGGEIPTDIRKESVIGRRNFVRVASLKKNDPLRQLSRKVGQLLLDSPARKIAGGICSGALVGHDLFLTNHHSIEDTRKGDKYYITMENLSGLQNMPKGSVIPVSSIIKADRYLDFALLQLAAPVGLKYGWLELARNKQEIQRSKAVKIIQHPAGRPKEFVTRDTAIVRHVGKFMHYKADTEGGSSGSPVFDLHGSRIIALHHVGTNAYNEGTRIDVIAKLLEDYLPDPKATPTIGNADSGSEEREKSKQAPAQKAAPAPTENQQEDSWESL